jgi:hypothetical protein
MKKEWLDKVNEGSVCWLRIRCANLSLYFKRPHRSFLSVLWIDIFRTNKKLLCKYFDKENIKKIEIKRKLSEWIFK